MEPDRGRLPRVSLHSLPPFMSRCPLPAIGYLKGYLETHRTGISVTAAYWHQALSRLARPWVDDHIMRGGSESYEELWDAVFARLYCETCEISQISERPAASEVKWPHDPPPLHSAAPDYHPPCTQRHPTIIPPCTQRQTTIIPPCTQRQTTIIPPCTQGG